MTGRQPNASDGSSVGREPPPPSEAEVEFLRLHAENLERDLRRVVRERDEGIQKRDAQIRNLEAHLASARERYRLVLSSRSWRLMAPARAVARALRRALRADAGRPEADRPE